LPIAAVWNSQLGPVKADSGFRLRGGDRTFLRGLCCNGVQGVAVDVGSVAVELGTVISLVVSPGVVGGGTVVVMPTVDREALVAGAVVAA
jgi:hypothetical protein